MLTFMSYLLAAGFFGGVAVSMFGLSILINRQNDESRAGCGLGWLGILAVVLLAVFCLAQAWSLGQGHSWP